MINLLRNIKNYLLWAASASHNMTPPKEENCFWASKATLAKVPLETNPLPAACADAGAPKYIFMFGLGDWVLAQWSLMVVDQNLATKTEWKCRYQVARLNSDGTDVSQKLLSSRLWIQVSRKGRQKKGLTKLHIDCIEERAIKSIAELLVWKWTLRSARYKVSTGF